MKTVRNLIHIRFCHQRDFDDKSLKETKRRKSFQDFRNVHKVVGLNPVFPKVLPSKGSSFILPQKHTWLVLHALHRNFTFWLVSSARGLHHTWQVLSEFLWTKQTEQSSKKKVMTTVSYIWWDQAPGGKRLGLAFGLPPCLFAHSMTEGLEMQPGLKRTSSWVSSSVSQQGVIVSPLLGRGGYLVMPGDISGCHKVWESAMAVSE